MKIPTEVNGCPVLAAALNSHRDEAIVLCDTVGVAGDPFATWRAWEDGDGNVVAVHGHYWQEREAAVTDFMHRVIRD